LSHSLPYTEELNSTVGKATHNPEKVEEGEVKKTHNYSHAQNEASEVRRDQLERERDHNNDRREGGVLGHNDRREGAYDDNRAGGTYPATGAPGSTYPATTGSGGAYPAAGGAYDANTANRY
jgi:hypothetical protein